MFRSAAIRMMLGVGAVTALVAYLAMPLVSDVLTAWYHMRAERDTARISASVGTELAKLSRAGDTEGLELRLSELMRTEHRLIGLRLCRLDGGTIARSPGLLPVIGCPATSGAQATSTSRVLATAAGRLQVSEYVLDPDAPRPSILVVAEDLGVADWNRGGWRAFVVSLVFFVAAGFVFLVILSAWWLLRRWTRLLVSDIRSGRLLDDARSPVSSWPILRQIRRTLQEAEQHQRLEIEYRENWTPQALRQVVQRELDSCRIIAVSNREPYSHFRTPEGSVEVRIPASGMVTALEPVMRACAGVWVAHGSGDADRDAVDASDQVAVPPGESLYTLRRVWLTEEEERAYYLGFSNEGLWPLCHQVYVRPAFRETDWQCYRRINERFAKAAAEVADSKHPVVLIQDFHFALLPGLLREKVPGATIAMFWHVPWPSAETFHVCPWKQEILRHLLQADVLGFHTLQHCHNVIDAFDRFVECHIDREHMTITLNGHVCHVAPYPISIEWPPPSLASLPEPARCREIVRQRYGIAPSVRLGVGVERWDFTKGIIERCQALEMYLERYPEEHGRIALLQVAEPSRSALASYQKLQSETIAEVNRINQRFGREGWEPIVLVKHHLPAERVFELYRAADFCLVTSLHDGMNLVAKEFVAARDDEDGVLILSTFTGASRELAEALLVNPYDTAETAAAIAAAVRMPREVRRARMRLMRKTVQDNNVYRWAGHILIDIARIRRRQQILGDSGSFTRLTSDAPPRAGSRPLHSVK